ncbi:MAG: hypothetical protein IJ174_09280, partial [Clostridia bacterium]|nr:hypothetical protein [Clostridia bacterium]
TITDGSFVSHKQAVSFRHTVPNLMVVEDNISGTKVLRGRELLPTDIFTFELRPAVTVAEGERYPGLPEGNVLTAHNHADGLFTFTLEYDSMDLKDCENYTATFTYLITELPPEGVEPGTIDPDTNILYSNQQFWLQVILKIKDGQLVTEKHVYTSSPLQQSDPTYARTQTEPDGEVPKRGRV